LLCKGTQCGYCFDALRKQAAYTVYYLAAYPIL
jgi:hypothetical protein